jgi:hypothetical protein
MTSQTWEMLVRLFGALLLLLIFVLIYYLYSHYTLLLAVVCLFSSVMIFLAVLGSIAYSMLYGRKRIVLVLRRFHRPEVGAVISAAHRKRLKRRYRLVTLYDAAFPRAGSPAGFQTIIWMSVPLMWFIASLVPSLLAQAFPITPSFTDNNLITAVGIQVFFADIWPFFFIISLVINLFLCFALMICLALHRWRIYRRTKLAIFNEKDLASVKYSVWSLGSWMTTAGIMGGRSTVVEVESHLWQEAVAAFASIAQGIIIDASHQSENLMWEINYCSDRHADKTVLIGANHSLDADFRKSLHVREVLTYDPIGKNDAFASKLRLTLDDINPSRRTRPKYFMRYVARDALLVPTMYLFIFCSTLTLCTMLCSKWVFGDSLMLHRVAYLFVDFESSELLSPETKKIFSMSLRELADHAKEERRKAGVAQDE